VKNDRDKQTDGFLCTCRTVYDIAKTLKKEEDCFIKIETKQVQM